ncbi:uncharacterized protein BX664DRAFT_146293 [Halteromyces radiatus]|uniref:uncharacterized protein n=1 Tax=Halteromyces radiatus TaxID=101107 RepID=UPI0022200CE0|nr:uncharacterized protein BX664DRAFT_146293 [Halteromyces radiatus]KAI8089987.1 hypothetical protein BX664DRAFT_146293 [Halteromyces radiatus]
MMLRRNSTSSNNDTKNEPSYTDLVERLRRCEVKLEDIKKQMNSAETMLQDLYANKNTLDTHCSSLHTLYDQIVPASPNDPSHIIEQHLKNEVLQLAYDIPRIENDIKSYSKAQKKLYESRELMEKAMMTLPGASTFLDRQALAGHGASGHHSLFVKSSVLSTMVDITVPSLKDAEKLASEAYELELQASNLCKDVPLIPSSTFSRDDNVVNVLTAYRGYRLKIETILRTQLNPRLNKLQGQLAMTKYHHEQKSIEWIDQQIIVLEDLLRQNGCLENINLDREISMLRMGSNAAIMAAAAETSGRVTVDDALEVTPSNVANVERNGVLPEYSANARGNGMVHPSLPPLSSSSTTSSMNNFTSITSSTSNMLLSPSSPTSVSPTILNDTSIPSPRSSLDDSPPTSSEPAAPHLPAYSQQILEQQQQQEHHDHQHEYSGSEAPPAYFR